MSKQPLETFVSPYQWLLAKGDCMRNDYHTCVPVKLWTDASPIGVQPTDLEAKRALYSQWVAQILQTQLGVDLVSLYQKKDQKQWPLALRDDVIDRLDEYFSHKQD